MSKEELYEALYTDLGANRNDEEKNKMRKNCLMVLLGINKDEELMGILERYKKEQKAQQLLDENGQDIAKEEFTQLNFDDISKYWQTLHHLYVCYLTKLKKSLEKENKTINKILIYEAPPMPTSKNKGKINYILAESCGDCEPLKDGKPCEDCKIICGLFKKKPDGAYSTTIKNLMEDKNKKIQDILVDQGILFIDLCPLPLPMTTDIRKGKWIEKKIDGKPLTVVLLELALRFALEKGIIISEKPIIAIGTPSATSQSIYLYFEKMISDKRPNPFISVKVKDNDKTDKEEVRKIDFSTLLNINRKYDSINQILPLYQSNIIAGSNTPNSELLKRIF